MRFLFFFLIFIQRVFAFALEKEERYHLPGATTIYVGFHEPPGSTSLPRVGVRLFPGVSFLLPFGCPLLHLPAPLLPTLECHKYPTQS